MVKGNLGSYLVVPGIPGKAQTPYATMSIYDSNTFDRVKEAILRRYDITEETYRQRFRSQKKGTSESYREMHVRLKDLNTKWVKCNVNDT